MTRPAACWPACFSPECGRALLGLFRQPGHLLRPHLRPPLVEPPQRLLERFRVGAAVRDLPQVRPSRQDVTGELLQGRAADTLLQVCQALVKQLRESPVTAGDVQETFILRH